MMPDMFNIKEEEVLFSSRLGKELSGISDENVIDIVIQRRLIDKLNDLINAGAIQINNNTNVSNVVQREVGFLSRIRSDEDFKYFMLDKNVEQYSRLAFRWSVKYIMLGCD